MKHTSHRTSGWCFLSGNSLCRLPQAEKMSSLNSFTEQVNGGSCHKMTYWRTKLACEAVWSSWFVFEAKWSIGLPKFRCMKYERMQYCRDSFCRMFCVADCPGTALGNLMLQHLNYYFISCFWFLLSSHLQCSLRWNVLKNEMLLKHI